MKQAIVWMVVMCLCGCMPTEDRSESHTYNEITYRNIDYPSSNQAESMGFNETKTLYETNDMEEIIYDRQILVKLNEGTRLDLEPYHLQEIEASEQMQKRNITILAVPSNQNFDEVLSYLRGLENVIYAEPNFVQEPNAVQFDSRQWYVEPIHLKQALSSFQSLPEVVIAVLDTGVNSYHRELSGQVLPGYDFFDHDTTTNDLYSHGTEVAGVIASKADGIGMTGVNPYSKILPVKISDAEGYIPDSAVIEGIYYAIEQEVDVINMSYGSPEYSVIEEDALKEAFEAGIVLVSSAGNEPSGIPSYPAAYPFVIGVGAIDQNLALANFSNFGKWVDVVAPGVDILAPDATGRYVYASGTSFSAPIVSAVAGLLKAIYPTWTPTQIEWALERGAIDSIKLMSNHVGYGLIDVQKSTTISQRASTDTSYNERTARSIPLNSKIIDTMEHPYDQDWFTFTVPNASNITVEIWYHSAFVGGLNTKIYSNSVTINHSVKSDMRSEAAFFSSPRTYFISVKDKYGFWSDLPYTVQINAEPVVVEDTDIPVIYEIAPILQGDTTVTGKTEANASVFVSRNGLFTNEVMADSSGRFNLLIPPQLAGWELDIWAQDAEGNQSEVIQQVVQPNDVSTFADVQMYAEQISFLTQLELFKGYENNTFKPTHPITRLQAVQVILRQMKIDTLDVESTIEFTDMKKGNYGYEAVAKAVELGIVTGKPGGAFDPNGILTRAQMAKIITEAYKLESQETTNFSDVGEEHWAYHYINHLTNTGISTGYADQTFHPNEPITRQHFALFMTRLFQYGFAK
ncbi:S8 family serine peptidase [Bacillus salitolerans]|uniref:S8 family serine peptidase n=1 Tax=Bacillus salitolerans TaxID=1437434 RepID=A0ABW4LSG0_9BACI